MGELMKIDLQKKLKDAVRDKFQELIDEKTLDKFVKDAVVEFQKDMDKHIAGILQQLLNEYVTNYLKTKMSVEYDGNRTKYDMVIVNAIRNELPKMFESMLGNMVHSAIQQWTSNNRF